MNKEYLFNTTVLIEPTNICNLKCIMCEAKCTKDNPTNVEHLSPDKLEIMLSKLDGYISNIVFQGDCEPTLNPYLDELVKVSKNHTQQVSVVTNGLSLTPEKIEKLVESGISWFAISIDSHIPDVYNNIRRYSNFEILMNNLDYLIELKKNRRTDITIVVHKIVFDEDNIESLKDYIRYFYIDKGVDKITFAPIVKQGNINNKNWLIMRNQIEIDMINDNIDINLRDFGNYPYRSIHKYCGTNLFFIGHNGDFAPCGLHTKSKDNFGNLLMESLDEITEKEVFNEYHRYWLNRDFSRKAPKICSNCYLLKSPYFVYCLEAGYEHGNKFKNHL